MISHICSLSGVAIAIGLAVNYVVFNDHLTSPQHLKSHPLLYVSAIVLCLFGAALSTKRIK